MREEMMEDVGITDNIQKAIVTNWHPRSGTDQTEKDGAGGS